MNIQLYLNNELVDLKDDEDFKLKKEFQDPEELITKEITYSYEVELPITTTNNRIFANSNNIDVMNKFNVVYDAQLYSEEVLIINGKFIINEVDTEFYKGNLYVPSKKELSDVLGDRNLNEIKEHMIKVNDFDDISRINNLCLSDDVDADKHVCFPYVLYNVPYNNYDKINSGTEISEKYYQTLNFANSNFSLNTIYPAFNVLSVLKDMFATEGYSLSGNVFQNAKFTGLYQTYAAEPDLYGSEKNTPYYCRFDFMYAPRFQKANEASYSISQTLTTAQVMGGLNVGFDTLLLSDRTTLSNVTNEYNMLVTNSQGTYSLIVPASGWYQINCSPTILLLNTNKSYYRQDDRTWVAGIYGDAEDCSFRQSAYEFQILKGSDPSNDIKFYSVNLTTPCVPLEYQEGDTGTIINDGVYVGMKNETNTSVLKYAHNQGTAIIKDLSGFDSTNFICGARWGDQIASENYGVDGESNAAPHRHYKQPTTLALPKPHTQTCKSKDDVWYWELQQVIRLSNTKSTYTYGADTAQVMVRADSYSNFEGYNVGDIEAGSRTGTDAVITITESDAGAYSYAGQMNSYAIAASNTNGMSAIHTCVWLEEGEFINLCGLMAYNQNHVVDKAWLGKTHFDDEKRGGVCNTLFSGTFEIGMVNPDKDWRPTENKPILATKEELTAERETNINLCLPDVKCNDYLENFLQTFNCRLTQTSTGNYSIDFNNTTETQGEVISIDEYADASSVKFERLTLPSTITLKWKIDTSEEGYVNGNNSTTVTEEERQLDYFNAEHDGKRVYENPLNTSGSEEKKESLWSYNWYRRIRFAEPNVTGIEWDIDVPIICDLDYWSDDYGGNEALSEEWCTDKTMRFFYINTERIYDNTIDQDRVIKVLPIYDIDADSMSAVERFNLIIPSNYITSYNMRSSGEVESKFMLDYDNSHTNKTAYDKTITDVLFHINIKNSYQITVECALPNNIFSKIRSDSLMVLNGGLFAIKQIEGHSVQGLDVSEVSLLSL